MLRRILSLLLCAFSGLGVAQIDTNLLRFYNAFEIPSGEEIVALHSTSTASSVLVTTKPGVLYLRPIDELTGTPIKVLSIKSNDEKRILRHEFEGDSIVCLVKSEEKDRSIKFEIVVYTLFNNQLAEASRNRLTIQNKPNQKNAEKLFFRIGPKAKHCATLRLVGYDISPDALIELEILNFISNKKEAFSLPLPFGADDLEITDVGVSKTGAVFFTAISGVKLNSPFLRKHLVYHFDPNSKELREYDVSKNKIYQQEMFASYIDESMHIMTTFTTDPMQLSATHGYGWVRIDSNGNHLSEKLVEEFNSDVKQSLQLDLRSSKESIEHLFADHIYTLSENPIGIFHQQYRDQVCTTDPRTGILSCTDQFHHDGIIVQFLDGDIAPVVINRVQIDYDQEGPYLGYTSAVINDHLYVLYNDHQKNTNTFAEREMSNPTRSNLRYVQIGPNGKSMSHAIDLDLERGFVLLPNTKGYQSDNKLYRLYSNGKDFRIGAFNTQRFSALTD